MVVPEMSALGGSRCPDYGIGVADSGEILQTLMEREFGSRPVTLMGLSLGGWMATRFALANPQKVSRLVLVDAGGYRDQDWNNIEALVKVNDMAGVDRLYKALFVRVPWVMRLSKATFLRAYTSKAVRNVLAGLSEADTFDDADPEARAPGAAQGRHLGHHHPAAPPQPPHHRRPGGGDRPQAVEEHPGLAVLGAHHVIDQPHRAHLQHPPVGAQQAQVEGGHEADEDKDHDGGIPPARRIPEPEETLSEGRFAPGTAGVPPAI